jgi:hypothetical protein
MPLSWVWYRLDSLSRYGSHQNSKGKNRMTKISLAKYIKRLLLSIALLLVHYLVVFIPLAEIFLLYLIFFKPKWLDDF